MAEPHHPSKGDVLGTGASGVVADRYIVVLKDSKASPSEVRAAATALTNANGGTVRRVFTSTVRGYSAKMTATQAKRLAKNPDVAYVEPVHRYSATDTQSNPPSWGLDRIDQTTPVLNRSYSYPSTGSGVTAYVLDTGIKVTHQEFAGRATSGYDFINNDADADDCNGHGTHVAGTIGGANYGVAKGVNLVGVKVLDCDGSGTTESVVAGIDWVNQNVAKPAVVNMSLGGDPDQVLDDAVSASIASGVTYALSAGNDATDACQSSPARVPAAITVGATDNVDFRAWFSNYGTCLDTFAPGVNITSAGIASDTATAALSGTSMASPHVAGAAALLLSANPALTPAQVRNTIVTSGISGAVHDAMGSANRLLHVGATQAARTSFGLKARINGKYVQADGGGTKPLIAKGTALGTWEKFDVVDLGGGLVALRAKVNGKYVTADGAGSLPLIARSSAVGSWEKFQIINNTDGTVSLLAKVNGKYVTADGAGSKPLIARSSGIGSWEKFDFAAPNPVISIKSKANGMYVTADGAGSKPLIARSSGVGSWEKFELVDAGNGYLALRALINGRYVSADGAGDLPLIARSTGIGGWERFWLVTYNTDGTIYLAADVNAKIVQAAGGGSKPLIAGRYVDWWNDPDPLATLGAWEKFTIAAV